MAQYPLDDYDLGSMHLNPRRYMLDDDLYGSSASRDTSDAFGSESADDLYNFDFGQHSSKARSKEAQKKKPMGKPSDPKARRASLDERTQAKLRQVSGAGWSPEKQQPTESIEDAWRSIMRDKTPLQQSALSPDLKKPTRDKYGSLDSPSDSLEISAADFEIGVIASRKKNELASSRISVDQAKQQEKTRGAGLASGAQTQVAQSAMFRSQLSSIRGSLEHDDTFEPTDHDLLDHLRSVANHDGNDNDSGGAKKGPTKEHTGYSDDEFELEADNLEAEDMPSALRNPQPSSQPDCASNSRITTSNAAVPITVTAAMALQSSSVEDIRRRWLQEPDLLLSSISAAPTALRESQPPAEPAEPEKPAGSAVQHSRPTSPDASGHDSHDKLPDREAQPKEDVEVRSEQAALVADRTIVQRERSATPSPTPSSKPQSPQAPEPEADRQQVVKHDNDKPAVAQDEANEADGEEDGSYPGATRSELVTTASLDDQSKPPTPAPVATTATTTPSFLRPKLTDVSFEDVTQCRSPLPPPAPESPRVSTSLQEAFAVDTSVASLPPPPPASTTVSIAQSDDGPASVERSSSLLQQSYALNPIGVSFDHSSAATSLQPVYHVRASAMIVSGQSMDRSVAPHPAITSLLSRDSLQTELDIHRTTKPIKPTEIAVADDHRPKPRVAGTTQDRRPATAAATAGASNGRQRSSPLLDNIKQKSAAKRVTQARALTANTAAASAGRSRKLNISEQETSALVKQMETLQKEMKELKSTVQQGRRTRVAASTSTTASRLSRPQPTKRREGQQQDVRSSRNAPAEQPPKAAAGELEDEHEQEEEPPRSERQESNSAARNESAAAQFVAQQEDLLHLLEEYKAQLETAQSKIRQLEQAVAAQPPARYPLGSVPTVPGLLPAAQPGHRLLGEADAQATLLAAQTRSMLPASPRESTDALTAIQPIERTNDCGRRIADAISEFDEAQRRQERAGAPGGSPTSSETVLISRQLLDDACKELHYQESLLAGYQKENEALLAQAKKARKQLEEDQKALEHERQLNNIQLRKLHTETARVSYRELRTELDLETARRTLEEQYVQREQELKFTVDQLRKELQQLNIQHQVELHKAGEARAALQREVEQEREDHQREMSNLRQRLSWYVENQELLDKKDALIAKQAEEIRALRSKNGHANLDSTMNNSRSSSTSAAPKPVRHRSPADIKRIQELEEQLRTMEESLRKRHPDSVANLIRANEIVQEREKELEVTIQRLRQQLEGSKDETVTKLRTLRQEHDKLKLYYETKISHLQRQLEGGSPGNPPSLPSPPLDDSNSSSAAGFEDDTPQTLEEAMRQIRTLKKDCERIRTFYTNKLQKAKEKSENMMRALKRGEESSLPTSSSSAAANKDATDKLLARIRELERQLQSTRITMAESAQLHEQQPQPVDGELWQNSKKAAILLTREAQVQTDSERSDTRSWGLIQASAPRPDDSKAQQLQVLLDTAEAERTRLLERTRALEEQLVQLRMNQSPDAVRYAALATQLDDMERRFALREQELQWAIQECRQAAKLEHSRLQALHQAELSEKDRQVLALRSELDSFVETLHQLMSRTGSTPAVVQTF